MRLLDVLARRAAAPALSVLAAPSARRGRRAAAPDAAWSSRIVRDLYSRSMVVRCELCGRTVSTVADGDVPGVLVALVSAHQREAHRGGGLR
ncbi:MAG: hypothetical protein FWH11_01450 [Micrococcales bacterium]|nr:hypothetical protein [Micrococcales bacterium]